MLRRSRIACKPVARPVIVARPPQRAAPGSSRCATEFGRVRASPSTVPARPSAPRWEVSRRANWVRRGFGNSWRRAGWYDAAMAEAKLGERIGEVIRRTRTEHRWSQDSLAERLHVSQSKVARLESGHLTFVDVELVSRAFAELGIRATFDANTLGLAGRREQRDLVHAACEGHVARRLHRSEWAPRLEVEIGQGRWRGWIDVLAFRASDRSLLVVEVKSELDDVGRIQRTIGWFEREAWSAAERLGWRPRRARSALLVLATAENDDRLSRNATALRATFPGSAAQLAGWVDGTAAVPSGPSLAMIDPHSRRARWLSATRSDGRRTRAPYLDYADAARLLAGHGKSSRD